MNERIKKRQIKEQMIFANKKTTTKNKQKTFGMINVILFKKQIFRWVYYLLPKKNVILEQIYVHII